MTQTRLEPSLFELAQLRNRYDNMLEAIKGGPLGYDRRDLQDLIYCLLSVDWINRAAELAGEHNNRFPSKPVSLRTPAEEDEAALIVSRNGRFD